MKLSGLPDGSTKGITFDGEGDIVISFHGERRGEYGLHIEHVNDSTFKNMHLLMLDTFTIRGIIFTLLFKAWYWLYRLGMKEIKLPDTP